MATRLWTQISILTPSSRAYAGVQRHRKVRMTSGVALSVFSLRIAVAVSVPHTCAAGCAELGAVERIRYLVNLAEPSGLVSAPIHTLELHISLNGPRRRDDAESG